MKSPTDYGELWDRMNRPVPTNKKGSIILEFVYRLIRDYTVIFHNATHYKRMYEIEREERERLLNVVANCKACRAWYEESVNQALKDEYEKKHLHP